MFERQAQAGLQSLVPTLLGLLQGQAGGLDGILGLLGGEKAGALGAVAKLAGSLFGKK